MSRKNTPSQKKSLQPEETETPSIEKLKFGNQDTEKKYDLSALIVPEDHFVVRHYGTIGLSDGKQTMEDPTTNRFQVYDVDTFKRLSQQPVKKGVQSASEFESLGMNVDILHDPTL